MKLDDLFEEQILGVADMVEHLMRKGVPIAFMGDVTDRIAETASCNMSSIGRLAFYVKSVLRHEPNPLSSAPGKKPRYVIFYSAGRTEWPRVWIREDKLDDLFKLEPMGHGYQIVNV